jgi:hypothetical protein
MNSLRAMLLCAAIVLPSTSFAITPLCKGERGLRSDNSRVPAKMIFTNEGSETALIYWINFKGKRVLYMELLPNSSYTQETYLTHPWVAVSVTGKCLGIFKPKRKPVEVVLE